MEELEQQEQLENPEQLEDPEQLEELDLLTPAQVGQMFGVDAKTVSRWANSKPPKIEYVLTPGGHKRYHRKSVQALFDQINGPNSVG